MTEATQTKTIDIYSEVTARIIADLEKGVRSWSKPWKTAYSANNVSIPVRHNGVSYRGVNVLLLWLEAMSNGFASPMWMTFKQAQSLGGHVCKGERGSMVVFASPLQITETDDAGEEIEKKIHLLKRYTVFNVEQIEGLPANYYPQPLTPKPISERIDAADQFVQSTGAIIRHGGNRAFYAPTRDIVQMPPFDCFTDKEGYYGTLLHELTHWTGSEKRLARKLGQKYGDSAYAAEELVAEIGAAFLCAELAVTPVVRESHAAYIGHWLSILKEDKRTIFRAAAHAQRAADFLKGLQPPPPEPEGGDNTKAISDEVKERPPHRPANVAHPTGRTRYTTHRSP